MESKMTSQLEQTSLADDGESSPPSSSSSLPSPPDSNSLPSFNSLPPELLIHIFESIPYHPHNQRVADLARFCLVNHRFLEITRPLLYRQVHLDFWADYEDCSSRRGQLLDTLRYVDHCSGLVKGIRISMEGTTHLYQMGVLSVLALLKAVESVEITSVDDWLQEELLQAIQEHQPGLRHLTMRASPLSLSVYRCLLDNFGELHTLIGRFDDFAVDRPPSSDDNLAFKLRRFVSHSTLKWTTFESILHSSWTSLTSLAFAVSPEHASHNLRQFKNLNTLRIKLEDDFDRTLDPEEMVGDEGLCRMRQIRIDLFAIQIGMILESIQSLPLETLSITVDEVYIPQTLSSHLLFKALPPSLRHFGTIFEFLDPKGVNHTEIAKAVRDGRLPHLEKITVFPSNGLDAYEPQPLSITWLRRKLSELDKELGISIDAHCTSSAGLITPCFTLEPYYVDKEFEGPDEGDWGEIGEDGFESEEVDEFRSDYEEDEEEEEDSAAESDD